ncbi:hypothetical protein [Streptomyces ferrugineus]|uniref:hypothetical protein n=1 Tax=Streptomyces ferrugineus TaxID=1413221 RepID=UPI001D1377CC|nr:hypothetical protein [Streptomyces ferrugineus]
MGFAGHGTRWTPIPDPEHFPYAERPPRTADSFIGCVERQRRDDLIAYLDRCSEDDLIERVLLPLFRQLGYQRITATGHKDKALEFGKDIWMKFVLPTSHAIYFGLQVKKNKLDAAGMSRQGKVNVAEILNQTLMMLGHEVFDPDFN